MSIVLIALAGLAAAQSIYRYQDDNGRWHYTDRPPEDGRKADVDVVQSVNLDPKVIVTRETRDGSTIVFAENQYHGPVEFELEILDAGSVGRDADDAISHVVLPPAEKSPVVEVNSQLPGVSSNFRYKYKYMLGAPDVEHDSKYLYRVPYAVAQEFPVTQAYPTAITHNSPDSRYAIDFEMPIGTAIHAAREGTVVAIAFRSYSGGTTAGDMQKANIVRIVHDDGTIATYAHLRLDSVRVRPGDRVERGEYLADSGNTGFSTGPHLHFAVSRNRGFNLESVPVNFLGAANRATQARSGEILQAY